MKRSHLLLLIAVLAAPLAASAGERLFIQIPAMVDTASLMPQAVKAQCPLEAKLGNYAMAEIAKRADPEVQSVASPEQAGGDKLVQLTILNVQAYGGGAWSGPKSVTVRVDMQKGGARIASTMLSRSTRGGALAGFTGTCTMLDKVVTSLGKDIAVWIARGAGSQPVAPGAKPAAPSDEPESAQ